MSGVIGIRPKVSWVAPGWIFDGVLNRIAEIVQETNVHLAERVRNGTSDRQAFGYLDLGDWTREERRLFLAAALEARARCERAGPVSWHDPKTFPGYMKRFEELIEALQKDR